MFLSIFDIFKIGIGPSSSHTMGPMIAAHRFLHSLENRDSITRIQCSLHGSLAFTGKGHGSDTAIILGLMGCDPTDIDPDTTDTIIERAFTKKQIDVSGFPPWSFDPEKDLVFDYDEQLPAHTNGMRFRALNEQGECLQTRIYYSVGGGFVLDADEMRIKQDERPEIQALDIVPHPFSNAKQMLQMSKDSGLSIADMKRANELAVHPDRNMSDGIVGIWKAMESCITRGLSLDGELPGSLHVQRRAKGIYQDLLESRKLNTQTPFVANEWLSVYAMAVNEENASGSKVVTAPTNGACGVIPAVLKHHFEFTTGIGAKEIEEFLLTAAAIGGIIKHNASISGAEVGCQGEVGSASAMAAAGLAAVMGATPYQVENAAEIALEHHLGMSCDPVGGLVQVPCIERNALGAVKAVTAASLAMHGDGGHIVSLDACIETMRQTGLDMNASYKETSKGGLAVNVVAC